MVTLGFLFAALHCSASSITVELLNGAPCGESWGALNAFVQGGTPPYSYAWNNGASGPYMEFLPPGTYTVTVTDDVGDTATGSGNVSVSSQHDDFGLYSLNWRDANGTVSTQRFVRE